MKIKVITITEWNEIKKDSETDVEAVEGDSCVFIGGVAFLVQNRNGWNNVVCIRVKDSKYSILQTFCTFRAWCEKQSIQFFRVRGNGKHTYKMLYLVCRIGQKEGKDCEVLFDFNRSDENQHHYIVKAY